MNTQTLANIKERYAKIYIVADEDSHKLISVMKQDILDLIGAIEAYQSTGTKTFQTVNEIIGAR